MKKKQVGTWLLRALLCLLIACNLAVIFFFSSESGEASSNTSKKVAEGVAETFVPHYEQKTTEEQTAIVTQIHPPVRKLAHMAEFGSLGLLISLLLFTFPVVKPYFNAAVTLGAVFLFAATDEFHQKFSDGRGPQFRDVLIDTSGAVISVGCLFLLVLLIRYFRKKPEFGVTRYFLTSEKIGQLKIAVAADLHGSGIAGLVDEIRKASPDLILIPGDLADDHTLADADAPAYRFLLDCAGIAPTYYSLGNHEVGCYHRGNPWRKAHPKPLPDGCEERILATGVHLLRNEKTDAGNITVCGLLSGLDGKKNEPDKGALSAFDRADGFRILLCHHPEYYVPYIRKTSIDLTVCGHAHGGQWRVFGHGVYAPGQGIFPKYTAGVIDGRCVISRGLGNHTCIPRIFNRPELVIIEYNSPEK